MAEKLPYFKFFTGEWANGSIVLENFSTQGVFINACCFYWSKQGNVLKTQLEKKIRSKKELKVLFDEEIIKIKDDFVVIEFLDNQMVERDSTSKKNSEAGKESARKRALKKQEALNEKVTPVEITFNGNSTIKNKKREEENKIRIRKEQELKASELFNRFWELYDKKVGDKTKLLKKFSLLKNEELEILFKQVPLYVASTPDKKYRKAPETYLNQKSFNDEIIISNGQNGKQEQSFNDKFFKGTTPGVY